MDNGMKTIITLIAISLLIGCKAPQVVTERTFSDTTIIRETTKIVTVPGQSAQSPKVNLDSLVNLIKSGVKPEVINRSLYYTDPETKIRVGLILDQMGNLSALCETQEQTIQVMQREIDRYRKEQTTTTITKQPNFWQRTKGLFTGLFIGLIVAIGVGVYMVFRTR